MRSFLIASAAGIALCASATAAPFSYSATSGEEASKAERSEGVLSSLFSTASGVVDFVFVGSKDDDDILLRFGKKEQGCTADEIAEAEAEPEPEKEKRRSGPEPIYFGF